VFPFQIAGDALRRTALPGADSRATLTPGRQSRRPESRKEVSMAAKAQRKTKTAVPTAETYESGISLETSNDQTLLVLPFSDHLRRVAKETIPGIEFDPQAKAWRVPPESVAVAQASLDAIRAEHAKMDADWAKVAEQAKAAVENAVVKNAYKAQDARSSGKILAVGDFYVAQANGKQYVAIHEVGILRQAVQGDTPEVTRWDRYQPQVGEQKSIVYKRGVGVVQERMPEKSNTAERARQPEATR
jgi:hypothetical protein